MSRLTFHASYLKAELSRQLITHWNSSCHLSRCRNVGGSGGTCRHLQGTSAGCSWGYTCHSPRNIHRGTTDTGSWCRRTSRRSYRRLHTSHLCSHRNHCQSEHWLRQEKTNKNHNHVSYIIPLLTLGSLTNSAPDGEKVYCQCWCSWCSCHCCLHTIHSLVNNPHTAE